MSNNPTRCGYVAIVGLPNTGKSTLINALAGGKIAIVTPKAQTTRSRILGIVSTEQTQIVFMDTPGIFTTPRAFEKAMVNAAWSSAAEADVILMVVDVTKPFDEENEALLRALKGQQKPIHLALNKIDSISKTELLPMVEGLKNKAEFADIFMISALKQDGVEPLERALAAVMPSGPWLFPAEQMTDMPERLLAAEITRETLFMKLGQELPYSVHVETERFEEKTDGSSRIEQTIYVEREGQKKIVLGEGGTMLKSIGIASRRQMREVLGRQVHLFLFVKVKEDWKNKPDAYRYLGLEYKN